MISWKTSLFYTCSRENESNLFLIEDRYLRMYTFKPLTGLDCCVETLPEKCTAIF